MAGFAIGSPKTIPVVKIQQRKRPDMIFGSTPPVTYFFIFSALEFIKKLICDNLDESPFSALDNVIAYTCKYIDKLFLYLIKKRIRMKNVT